MDDHRDKRRLRRRWPTAAFVVFLAVAVAGALRLHRAAEAPKPPMKPTDGRYSRDSEPTTRPGEATPAGVLAPLGLVRRAELPVDIPAPAGGRVRSILSRRIFGSEQIKAEFAVRGALDAVAEQTAGALAKAGWRSVSAAAPARQVRGGRWMNFRKSADTMTVRLHAEGDWVMIVTTVQRAGPAENGNP